MTLDQIRYVLEIAKCQSINKAANNLFISQSSLSNAIKNLENELNEPLFIRTNRGVTLTKFGETFVSYIEPLQLQIKQLDALAKKKPQGRKHTLSVASSGFEQVSNICSAIYKNYKGSIRIEQYDGDGDETINMVANGVVEVGLIRIWNCYFPFVRQQMQSKGVQFFPLESLQLAITVGKNNPLYYLDADFVTVEQLAPYPMVMNNFTDKGPYADILDRLGLNTYADRFVTDSRTVIHEYVTQTDAWYLNSDHSILKDTHFDDERSLILLQDEIRSEIGWIKQNGVELSPLASAFIDALNGFYIAR